MALLAARHAGDANSPVPASVARAVDHAAGFAQRGAEHTLLADETLGNRIAASAMLALAIRRMPRAVKKTWDRRGALLNGLVKELDALLTSRPATLPAYRPADLYVAFLALASVKPGEGNYAAWLARLRKELAGVQPNWPAEHALACRAGIVATLPTESRTFAFAQLGADALPDERGAFALPGERPATVETALTAVCIARALAAAPATAPANRQQLRRQQLAARRFCYSQMFQPGEAYFAADPNAWVGGVRAKVGSARVTLGACAAAIEALLAE
jgi:hypothetical protein